MFDCAPVSAKSHTHSDLFVPRLAILKDVRGRLAVALAFIVTQGILLNLC